MNTEAMDSKNTGNAVPQGKFMGDLRLAAADGKELLHNTASQTGIKVAVALALIQENLQVVRESVVAAEGAVVEHTLQAAKVTTQYVHDNAWNWQ